MKTAVIIVNYNGGDLLLQTLESLYEHTDQGEFDLFLADNNSDDGSAEKAEKAYPGIKLIKNNENLGFGRAHNEIFKQIFEEAFGVGTKASGIGESGIGESGIGESGISESGIGEGGIAESGADIDQKYDYIALLNPDLILTPGWLPELKRTFGQDENMGAVNPLIVYADKFDILEGETTNPAIYLHHEDYRFFAPLVGKNEGKDAERKRNEEEMKNLQTEEEDVEDKGAQENRDNNEEWEVHEDPHKNIFERAHDYVDYDAHHDTKEVQLLNKQFIQLNNHEFKFCLQSHLEKLDLLVYDEGLNGYRLKIGGIQLNYGTLMSMVRKVFFKLGWVKLDTKIQEYSYERSQLSFTEQNVEIVNSLGAEIKPGNSLPENRFYGRKLDEVPQRIHQVQLFHGSCVLLKAEAVRRTGGFDDQFFMYYEESDLALRMSELGYKIFVNPKVVIRHKERGSRSDKSIEFMLDSARKFATKWSKASNQS